MTAEPSSSAVLTTNAPSAASTTATARVGNESSVEVTRGPVRGHRVSSRATSMPRSNHPAGGRTVRMGRCWTAN